MADFLKQAKNTWHQLASGATWLVAVIGSFLVPPPIEKLKYFASFLIAVILGVFLVAVNRLSNGRAWRQWLKIGIALVLSTTVLFFTYDRLLDAWTLVYATTTRVVIGRTYTPETQKYRESLRKQNGHYPSDLTLLEYSGGQTLEVWYGTAIFCRRLVLGVAYVVTACSAASVVLTIVQTVRLSEPKKRRKSSKLSKS